MIFLLWNNRDLVAACSIYIEYLFTFYGGRLKHMRESSTFINSNHLTCLFIQDANLILIRCVYAFVLCISWWWCCCCYFLILSFFWFVFLGVVVVRFSFLEYFSSFRFLPITFFVPQRRRNYFSAICWIMDLCVSS